MCIHLRMCVHNFLVRDQGMASDDWSMSGHLKWCAPPESFLIMKYNHSHSEPSRAIWVNSVVDTFFDSGWNTPVSFAWVSLLCLSYQQQVSVAYDWSNLHKEGIVYTSQSSTEQTQTMNWLIWMRQAEGKFCWPKPSSQFTCDTWGCRLYPHLLPIEAGAHGVMIASHQGIHTCWVFCNLEEGVTTENPVFGEWQHQASLPSI